MIRHPSAPTPTVLKIAHFLLRCIFNNKSSLTAGRKNQPAVEPNAARTNIILKTTSFAVSMIGQEMASERDKSRGEGASQLEIAGTLNSVWECQITKEL